MTQSPSVRECLDMMFDLSDQKCFVDVRDNTFYIEGLPADVEPCGDFPITSQIWSLTGGETAIRSGLACEGIAVTLRIVRPRPDAPHQRCAINGYIQPYDVKKGPPLAIVIAAAERG